MIWLFEKLPSPDRYKEDTSNELNKQGIFKESEPERILAAYGGTSRAPDTSQT